MTAFQLTNHHLLKISTALRLLTPPMETPDPPNDIPGALKQVVLTPHDIPWSLRVVFFDGTGNLKVLLSLGISMFWPLNYLLFGGAIWAGNTCLSFNLFSWNCSPFRLYKSIEKTQRASPPKRFETVRSDWELGVSAPCWQAL